MVKPTNFRDETRRLFLNRPASLSVRKVAARIDVSVSWLNAFGRGKIDNPGVNTMFELNAFLKSYAEKVK